MIDDAAHRNTAEQRADTAEVIYPPPWYLDLVRGRLEAVRWAWGSGAAGAWSGVEPPAAGDDAELVALAEAILGLDGLGVLPYPTKRRVCGVDHEEVRRYLSGVAAELRAKARAAAHADPRLGAPA